MMWRPGFGKLLKAGAAGPEEGWEVSGPAEALISLADGAGNSLGAVGVQVGPQMEAQLRQAIAEIKGAAKVSAAKAVVAQGKAAELEKVLQKLSIKAEKIVAREGAFIARFLASAGKLMVSAAAEAAPAASGKVRVLIVDDSPTIRKLLTKILGSDPEIEVVAGVGHPKEVIGAIEQHRPDVITLDIHLPEMNGVELLRSYVSKHRIPTVMISSISMEEGPLVLNALESGAVDYIQKPSAQDIAAVSSLIIGKVKTAKGARVRARSTMVVKKASVADGDMDASRVIAVGSSTGGTEALKDVLLSLPAKIPPIVVVQHIPAVFSKAFADRLNQICPFRVVEGVDGELVEPGKVIIAPGGFQMSLKKRGNDFVVHIEDSPPVNRHKPSVDVLFYSVAELLGKRAVGLILTGMGADGAKGLLAMKKAGSPTIGQDEASCVVFGMPQAAHKLGATDRLVALPQIADALIQLCRPRARNRQESA